MRSLISNNVEQIGCHLLEIRIALVVPILRELSEQLIMAAGAFKESYLFV